MNKIKDFISPAHKSNLIQLKILHSPRDLIKKNSRQRIKKILQK